MACAAESIVSTRRRGGSFAPNVKLSMPHQNDVPALLSRVARTAFIHEFGQTDRPVCSHRAAGVAKLPQYKHQSHGLTLGFPASQLTLLAAQRLLTVHILVLA